MTEEISSNESNAEPPRFRLHNIRTPPTPRYIVKGKLGLRNNINQTILNSCLFSYLLREMI